MSDRHIPDDEYIDFKACRNKEPHEDHYWFNAKGVEFYCGGR